MPNTNETPEVAYRGGTRTFQFGFFADDGQTQPLIPGDATTYPRAQVRKPDGQVYLTATPPSVRAASSIGFWAYDFHVPVDAELTASGEAWEISAEIILASGRHVTYCTTFVVKDPTIVKASNQGHFYPVISGRGIRVMYRDTDELYRVTLQVVSTNGETEIVTLREVGSGSGDVRHIESDGVHVYYYDIPSVVTTGISSVALTEGDYLVYWLVQEFAEDAETLVYQHISVIGPIILKYAPQVRIVVDKLNKRASTRQSYSEAEIIGGLQYGIQLVNSVMPSTSWNHASIPDSVTPYMITAAGIWCYLGQLGLAVDLQFNFCTTGDTFIRTAGRGLVRADELLAGIPTGLSKLKIDLLTPNGVETTKRVYVSEDEVPTIKITTYGGHTLRGRRDHPVLTLNTTCGRLEFVKLRDLTADHYVAIDRSEEAEVTTSTIDTQPSLEYANSRLGHHAHNMLPFAVKTERVNKQLARLLGYAVAEGSNRGNAVSFCNKDPRLLADFSQLCEKLFGESARCSQVHDNGTQHLTSGGITGRRFLRDLGLRRTRSPFNRVPWSVMQSSTDIGKSFLQAYFDGDGCAYGDLLIFSSASRKLLSDVQLMLLRVGVVTQIRRTSEYDSTRYGKMMNVYGLFVQGQSADRYAEVVGFRFKDSFQPASKRYPQLETIPGIRTYIESEIRLKIPSPKSSYLPDGTRVSVSFDVQSGVDNYNRDHITYAHLETYLSKCGPELAEHFPRLHRRLTTLLHYRFHFDRVVNVADKKPARVYDFVLPSRTDVPLDHMLVTNGIVSHNSGQTTVLDQDQTGGIESILSRFETMLWERLAQVKTDIVRHQQRVGVVATRPSRARHLYNTVFRTSSTSPQLIFFLNSIGLI